jgi:uncharacterized protein YjbJ (UPF0337 family)
MAHRPGTLESVDLPAKAGNFFRRSTMNWDVIKGKWGQVKGQAKEKWGDLTDDELDQIEGNKDVLVGKLHERYGWAREEAEQAANDWADTMDRDEA